LLASNRHRQIADPIDFDFDASAEHFAQIALA
jgi:hypothetical protein